LAPRLGFSQTPAQVVVTQFGGLNDTDPSATLANGQAQDLLNVEASLTGNAILKRSGFSRAAALSVSTSPVNGSFFFVDANGNNQVIVCQDHNCAKSTNNAAFSVFLTTAGGTAIPTRWSFVQINGAVYGANDLRDAVFKYDGTTLSYPATIPAGSILELTKDRMVVADVGGNPNGVYYSQSGVYTNFTTGLNSVDPYVDSIGSPGNRTSGLKYALGRLFIFKTSSITSCFLGDQYTSRCTALSNNIGTSDPLSIVEIPGAIVFRGQDGNFWSIDQSYTLSLMSRQISNLIKTQSKGSTQSNTQTSQSDWNAGAQFPSASWNTSTTAGSVFPSSVDFLSNSTATFALGSLTNVAFTPDFKVSISSSWAFDDFGDGDFTTGRTTWTITGGNPTDFRIDPAHGIFPVTDGLPSAYTTLTGVANSSGSWKFTFYYTTNLANSCQGVKSYCIDYRFAESGNGDFYSLRIEDRSNTTDKKISIIKSISSSETTLVSTDTFSVPAGVEADFEVQRSTDGRMWIYGNSVFLSSTTADTDVSGIVKTELVMARDVVHGVETFLTDLSWTQYSNPGIIVSTIYDTSYTNPVWGPLSSTFTLVNSEGQVDFYTQTSTSPNNDMWDGLVAASDTVKIGSSQKRYIRYQLELYTFISTKTPTVSTLDLAAATTGQFVTQCIQPGSGITSWGILSCAETKSGNGSLVYYATSAVSCANLPATAPNTWQSSLSNNATITISTNVAMAIGFRSLLTSATDQAQVDACTVFWTNGVVSPPSWGTYDSVKNAIYWTSAINNSSSNNRVLKYDLNLGEWFPFGISANAINNIQTNTYFGDSTGGYWNLYGGVSNDNGSAINAYWKSKDFSAGAPFQDKSFNRISLVTKNQVTGNMTATYTLGNNSSRSYTISLSTTSGANYVHSNYALPLLSPQQFLNLNLGNNSSTPFEIDGIAIDAMVYPWKAQNP
jgi:hypothetical protein